MRRSPSLRTPRPAPPTTVQRTSWPRARRGPSSRCLGHTPNPFGEATICQRRRDRRRSIRTDQWNYNPNEGLLRARGDDPMWRVRVIVNGAPAPQARGRCLGSTALREPRSVCSAHRDQPHESCAGGCHRFGASLRRGGREVLRGVVPKWCRRCWSCPEHLTLKSLPSTST